MEDRKRVIVVGGGFGGLAAVQALAKHPVDVVLIDRSNHHLFQPLLYQVATAALSPADVATATRSILRRYPNVVVVMDEVLDVNASDCFVTAAKSGRITFDYLVLATGADYSFFGRDEWAAHAPVLKTVKDALGIRERLLATLEEAERSDSEEEIARLLTFVVVGGGPTGVEMAGAIAELARSALAKDFRRVAGRPFRIVLVEAGKSVLASFSGNQSAYAQQALRAHGVEVMLGHAVEKIDDDGIVAGGERVRSANVIWCAGTQARPAAEWLGAETARNRAVIVQPDCSVPGFANIFAIGDVASYRTSDGKALPGLAPVAKQQGRYVGEVICRRIAGREPPSPFRYRNWGSMAVIGRSKAIADFGHGLRLNGYVAWLAWSMVHLFYLIDFRSRFSVYVQWAFAWFTHRRGVRLLTKDKSELRSDIETDLMRTSPQQ